MKRKKEKVISIRTKLLGIILPVVIVIVTILVGISYKISRTTVEKAAQNLLQTSWKTRSARLKRG